MLTCSSNVFISCKPKTFQKSGKIITGPRCLIVVTSHEECLVPCQELDEFFLTETAVAVMTLKVFKNSSDPHSSYDFMGDGLYVV